MAELTPSERAAIFGEFLTRQMPHVHGVHREVLSWILEAGETGISKSKFLDRYAENQRARGEQVSPRASAEKTVRAMMANIRTAAADFFDPKRKGWAFEIPENEPGRGHEATYRITWVAPEARKTRVSSVQLPLGVSHLVTDSAFAKLDSDFRYSVLRDQHSLDDATGVARDQARFMIQAANRFFEIAPSEYRQTHEKFRGIEKRFSETNVTLLNQRAAAASEPEATTDREFADILSRDLIISCECIEVAALATLLSIQRKYHPQWRIDFADRSGREQMLTIAKNGDCDFLITADGPFFFFGDGPSKRYSHLAAIHAENQYLLKHGAGFGNTPRILVYARSSALVQFLNVINPGLLQKSYFGSLADLKLPDEHVAYIRKSLPCLEIVETLASLVVKATEPQGLVDGDMIFAWTPLCDGLIGQNRELRKWGKPFHHWISLYAHTNVSDVAGQFLQLFANEWEICRKESDRGWARKVLADFAPFWDYFPGGGGWD